VVVNESFARGYWPDDTAVGRRITVDFPNVVSRTIVGIVGDVREAGYESNRPGDLCAHGPTVVVAYL
jgi:hypothetical protein